MNNHMALSLMSAPEETAQYFIIFDVKNKKYAMNIRNVVEVINIPKVEMPQTTPEGIIGMFNYNGTMIKTVDLCPFLGFETPKFSINNRIIIACYKDEFFAVLTEDIETITIFEEENIQLLPYSSEYSLLKQVYKRDKGNVNIIDTEALYELISAPNAKKSKINYANYFPNDEKARQILNLRAQNHVTSHEAFSFPDSSQSAKQFILFTMDNQNYFMDIKYVKEFISLKRLTITKLPYTQDYITGIVSVKGEFLVVFNLKRFLNANANQNRQELLTDVQKTVMSELKTVNEKKYYRKQNQETKNGKLIVVEGKNFNIAFLVDDIKYIRNLKDVQKSKIYSSSHNYIYAEFMENDELYSILNFEDIINDDRLYINVE